MNTVNQIGQNNLLLPPLATQNKYEYFGMTAGFHNAINGPIHDANGDLDCRALALKVLNLAFPLIVAINLLLLPFIALLNYCCSAEPNEEILYQTVYPADALQHRLRAQRHLEMQNEPGTPDQKNIGFLSEVLGDVRLAILRKSPHFERETMALFHAFQADFFPLRERGRNIDFSQMTIRSVEPVHFKFQAFRINNVVIGDRLSETDAYEVVFDSNVGRLCYYIPNKDGISAFREDEVADLQRIERVEPFLDKAKVNINHLLRFNLPILGANIYNLQTALFCDDQGLDYSKLVMESIREVRYVHDYRPMGGDFIASSKEKNGYEVNFQSPNGPIQYYIDQKGASIASPDAVRDVVVL